jgi:KDO2-lipid IV(A) lauroyltransferase
MMVYIFFRIAVAFTGLIPYPILYKISNGIAWIMRAVIGYRRDVVKQNLDYIFPDMPKEEVRTITKAIYRNLTDVILESLKSYTMSIEDINRRYLFKNKEELGHLKLQTSTTLPCGCTYQTS